MRSQRIAMLGLALLAAACSSRSGSEETVGTSTGELATVCGAPSNGATQGRDVSVYQGAFDWSSQKSGGVDFGYARIGDGLGGDDEFAGNWSRMKAAGVLRGAYQFFEPGEDATAQANLMIDAVGKLGDGDLPCMIDVEVTGGQSGATIATKVKKWLDLVEAGTGKKPMIYTGPYFWADNVGSTEFGDYPLWIADYGPSCPLVPPGWSDWTIWQYSDGGGSLDHDVFNGSLAELQKLAGGAQAYRTVVHSGSGDINGDGTSDVCARAAKGMICSVSNQGAAPTEIDGPEWSDDKGWNKVEYYSSIQLTDVNGDEKADLCARDSQGIVCEISNGNGFDAEIRGPAWSDDKGWTKPEYENTIQFGDVDGDGKADVCARAAVGMICEISSGAGFPTEIQGPAFADDSGWSDIVYYRSITLADVNGDGKADVCARGAAGVECHLSDGAGFGPAIMGPAWSDDAGWSKPQYEETIHWADVNGDGKVDVCGRAAAGIVCELSDGNGFPTEIQGPKWSDDSGWAAPQFFTTIQFADIDGNGKADLCARAAAGIVCELSNGNGFPTEVAGPAWSSASGWDAVQYDATIGFSDIDGDGLDDVCGRAAAGVLCARSKGSSFADAAPGPTWSDDGGWSAEEYYSSVRYGGANVDAKNGGVAPAGSGSSGPSASADGSAEADVGCSCRVGREKPGSPFGVIAIAAMLVTSLGRRRRRAR